MAGNVQIDDRGARDMFRVLQEKTGASYRDVVRGVSAEVLTLTAQKTKSAKRKDVYESVEKILRKPFRTSKGALIGRTNSGKVWYSGPGWNRNNWVLVEEGAGSGQIRRAKNTMPGSTKSRGRTFTSSLVNEINLAIREVNEFRKRERRERALRVAAGKGSWIEIMSQLGMQPSNTRGLGNAMKAKIDPAHMQSVSGTETTTGQDVFNVRISSSSTSALNPNARGIGAFRAALNGKVKEFKRAAEKDLKEYAKRFAERHGFVVK